MRNKSFLKMAVALSALLISINANAALVYHDLSFDNIQPAQDINSNIGFAQLHGTNYAGFNWGEGWFATSQGIQDTYLATSNNSLLIQRTNGEAFEFKGFEYWSRGGDGDGRKFFYVLYGSNNTTIYNSDDAGEDLKLRNAHNTLSSAYNGLIYGMAIGFINGGDNDGWKYMAIDDFKFGVDASANLNTNIPGLTVSNVPVPGALPLFLSGLSLFGLLNRKQK